MREHVNDPWVQRAKAEGWRSRAAFKLMEVDDKDKLIRKGAIVVDLGCTPGGWSQVASRVVGPTGRVVGIDLLEIEPMAGVEFITLDFLDPEAPDRLTGMLGGPADLVMSDMAANATGHKKTDHLRTIGLAERALEYMCRRVKQRVAFGKTIAEQGTIRADIVLSQTALHAPHGELREVAGGLALQRVPQSVGGSDRVLIQLE